MKLLMMVLLLLAIALPAFAQQTEPEYPLLSVSRLAIAAGGQYAFNSRLEEPQIRGVRHEWEFGLAGAYKLTPHLALTSSSFYAVDTKVLRTTVGLRVKIFQGKK